MQCFLWLLLLLTYGRREDVFAEIVPKELMTAKTVFLKDDSVTPSCALKFETN